MIPDNILKQFESIWDDSFDYSDAEYITNKQKIHVRCKKHDVWFWITPEMHLKVRGCPKCDQERKEKINNSINEKFIKKCKEIYGDRFTYEKTKYSLSSQTVIVTCKKHGDIEVFSKYFLSGKGCPKCNKEIASKTITKSWKECLSQFREVHGDKYTYDETTYKKTSKKIRITCPIHGDFWQTPNKHQSGQGCPKCGHDSLKGSRYTREEYIDKVRKVHGDKYDYSLLDFNVLNDKCIIICHEKDRDGNEHGQFMQSCSSHLNGNGCPKCAQIARNKHLAKTSENFIEDARKLHKDCKYDYSNVEYVNRNTLVKIICQKHGEFLQKPMDHLKGHGCPICGISSSAAENDIVKFLYNLGVCGEIIERDRRLLKSREIDILLPKFKLGIEYNGLYWHSEINGKFKNYHLEKEELMKCNGYSLIQIFEDEYTNKKDIVFSKIKRIIEYDNDFEYINEKDCVIKELNHGEISAFLNTNDIEGECNATCHIAAIYNNEIVCSMSFIKNKTNNAIWSIKRCCIGINYTNDNLFKIIFDYFIEKYNPKTIYAYSDRRWDKNEETTIFNKIGLKFDGYTKPEYRYYNYTLSKTKRIDRSEFRKDVLMNKYGLKIPEGSGTLQNRLNFSKVWDCGKYKYILNNNN